MNTRYGIWSGRFNIIHNGQESVLKKLINQYDTICIDIMNPTPGEPDWKTIDNNEKYSKENNPLTYFQRLYLWSIVVRYYSVEAIIVPHWPPLKNICLEKTFLPPKNHREWIIPNLRYSEQKAKDLLILGERVNQLDIDPSFSNYSSSHMIKEYGINTTELKSSIPRSVFNQTINFLEKKSINKSFLIIPILEDTIDPRLICCGIQRYCDIGDCPIFSPVVDIGDCENWWEHESLNNDYFSFFQKYKIIKQIMHYIEINDYYVIPILKKGNHCYRIDDFLPQKRTWLFKEGTNTNNIFQEYYNSESVIFDKQLNYNNKLFLDVSDQISKIFYKQNYHLFYHEKRKDENNMPYNDFNGATLNIGGDFVAHDKNTYISNLSTKDLPGVLDEIFKTDNLKSFETLFAFADEKAKNMTEEEQKSTVEISLKKHIDTEEKKNGFLQKIKEAPFDIAKSVVGGLILHAIKILVFGV